MARSRTYKRHQARHLKDNEVLVNMTRLLETLRESSDQIVWYGSRESDTLRLEAMQNGMIIRLLHYLPREHELYEKSGCFVSGKEVEEVHVEIRDISRSTGLTNLVKEHFDKTSPLFELAVELFGEIRQRTSLQSQMSRDTLHYAHTVAIATKIIATQH